MPSNFDWSLQARLVSSGIWVRLDDRDRWELVTEPASESRKPKPGDRIRILEYFAKGCLLPKYEGEAVVCSVGPDAVFARLNGVGLPIILLADDLWEFID